MGREREERSLTKTQTHTQSHTVTHSDTQRHTATHSDKCHTQKKQNKALHCLALPLRGAHLRVSLGIARVRGLSDGSAATSELHDKLKVSVGHNIGNKESSQKENCLHFLFGYSSHTGARRKNGVCVERNTQCLRERMQSLQVRVGL